MNSEPPMLKKGTLASPATARARSVLPVPGGPESDEQVQQRRALLLERLRIDLDVVLLEQCTDALRVEEGRQVCFEPCECTRSLARFGVGVGDRVPELALHAISAARDLGDV